MVSRSFFIHLILAATAASLFVSTVLPLNLFVLLAWLALLVTTATSTNLTGFNRSAILVTSVLAFGLISFCAYVAPIKSTYSHFNEPVNLPRTELSIKDIQDHSRGTDNNYFPVILSISGDDASENSRIRFASTQLSLGEFVTTVEEQTPLRHSLAQCGNAYTILWGYPPSYYMHFRNNPAQARYAP